MGLFPLRKVTASFIGVFIIGVAVGWLNASLWSDTKFINFLNRTNDPVSMANRINQKYLNEYQLTPDEQTRIAPLTKELAQHLYQLRHQFGTDIIATLDEFHQKIAKEMTPAQREMYAKANEDRKSRMVSLLLADPPKPDPGQK